MIRLSEVIKFSELKVEYVHAILNRFGQQCTCNLCKQIRDDTVWLRRDMSEKLKKQIAYGEKPRFERRIYIQLPNENEHKEHVTGKVNEFY